MTTRQFTKDELFEHCDSNSDKVFIVIHENVYDVTPFLGEVRLAFNFSLILHYMYV